MRCSLAVLIAIGLISPVSLAQPSGGTPSQAAAPDAAAKGGLDALLKFMTGSFSSQEQGQADPENYFDIRLEMVPIWTERTDGRWLYVEQAAASSLDRPYRQRIYCVTEPKPGEFVSAVYELPGDPLAFAGAFKDPGKLKDLSPEKLTARDGCSIVLRPAQDGTFNGATDGTGCVSTLRGASYATSEAHIGPDGLRTWDRGYDKDGKQVWGAQKGPYIFKRIK